MAVLKKNQLNNVLVPMVDKTDFATLESTLDAADINIKLYGVAQGVSTLASTITVSKAARLVRSGIFQITLKATETDAYDHYMLRLSSTSTVSCAIQLIPLEMVDNDDSDLMSALTLIQSMASDAASAAQQGNSRVLVVQSIVSDVDSQLLVTHSLLSDVQSALSNAHSDLRSQISGITATLSVSDISDIASRVQQVLASDLSDILSAAQQGNSRILVVQSLVSDVDSQLLVTHSLLSDVQSFLSNTHSDLRSQISGITATLTVSDISDIASRVQQVLASDLSDILSAAQQGNSRVLVVQSLVSDVDSQLLVTHSLLSDVQSALSNTHSDLRSQISGITASISASDISDIASAVQAIQASRLSDILSVAQQGNSRILVVQSLVSDVDSQLLVTHSLLSDVQSALSNTHSDLRSQISGITATLSVSDISDIASRVQQVLASDLSDILSAAQQGNSRVLVVQSMVSDVDSQLTATQSLLSDFESNFTSRVPKLVASQSLLSDIQSNLLSYLVGLSGAVSDVESQLDVTQALLSDHDSNFQSRIPKLVASQSLLSDVRSDLRSQISGITATLSVSDISDIASRVQQVLASDLSDILSAAQQGNSRILVVQSLASDIDSQLTLTQALLSDFESNLTSRVPKLVATQSQLSDVHSDLKSAIGDVSVTLTQSDISDIASAVAEAVSTVGPSDISDIASAVQVILASRLSDILSAAQQGNSRVLVVQSMVSDTDSQLDATQAFLSNFESNFESRVPKLVASQSQLSDVRSDLGSQIAGITAGVSASDISDIASAVQALQASQLSDILSAAQQGNSRILLVQSQLSDVDSQLTATHAVLGSGIAAETHDATLIDQLKLTRAIVEHQRGGHTHQPMGNVFFVDPVNGASHASGNRGGIADPYASVQDCHDNAVTDSNHDLIILLSGAAAGATTLSEAVTLSKRYLFIRGPGRDFIWTRPTNGDTITITADGVELFGFQVNTAGAGVGNGITVTSADFFRAEKLWINNTQGHGIQLTDVDNAQIIGNHFHSSGQSGAGHGLVLDAGNGESGNNILIVENHLHGVAGDSIRLATTGTGVISDAVICQNHINNSSSNGINIVSSGVNRANIYGNIVALSGGSDISDNGTNTVIENNEQWARQSLLSDVYSDLRSYLSGMSGALSDVESQLDVTQALLSDHDSNFQSRVPKLVASQSLLSDVQSDLRSQASGIAGAVQVALASDLSDILSAAQQGNSRVLVTQSLASDAVSAAQQGSSRTLVIQSRLSDVESQLDATDATLSNVQSQVTAIKTKTDGLPVRLIKNQAVSNFEFLMVLASDHVTPATGLTIVSTRSIDGAGFGATTNTAVEVGNGIYKIDLSAADMNGDSITFRFAAATADDRFVTVLPQPNV